MLVSTSYFPPIVWFAILSQNSEVIIESQEHFVKQTYRNRARIMSANGTLDLIVPVVKPNGSKTNITEVEISYAESWQKQHIHAIVSAYQSSPFFEYYKDYLLSHLQKEYSTLWEMNFAIITTCMSILKIQSEVIVSDAFSPVLSNINDFRYNISPKQEISFVGSEYEQVFGDKFPFEANLSILDLICNLGPESLQYLKSVKINC